MNRTARELANTIATAERTAQILYHHLERFAPGEIALIQQARELHEALRSRTADTWLAAQWSASHRSAL